MATIVTRSGKGSALTHNEMDANFTNLNNDKPDSTDFRTVNGTSIIGEGDITLEVEITDSVSTTSSTIAASATAVKTAYDKAASNDPITLSPGSKSLSGKEVSNSTSSNSFVKIIEYYTREGGEITASFKLSSDSDYRTSSAQIYINGSAYGTLRANSKISGITYTENIIVEAGDFIQVYAKGDSSIAWVSGFKLLVDELPYSTYTLP